MKKVISITFALLAVAVLSIPTLAATLTKQDLITELKSGVTINGKVNNISDKYIKVAEDFLDANDLTDDQISQLHADGQKAKKLWADTGCFNFTDMPTEKINELVELATSSAKKVGATLTYDGKEIKVVDKSGKVFKVTARNEVVIKPTGSDMNATNALVLICLVVVALSAVSIVVFKSKLTRNK